MDQRVGGAARRRAGAQVVIGVEKRMRFSAFGGSTHYVVEKRVDLRGSDIGVAFEVEGRIEQGMGLPRAASEVMEQRVHAAGNRSGIPAYVERRVEQSMGLPGLGAPVQCVVEER